MQVSFPQIFFAILERAVESSPGPHTKHSIFLYEQKEYRPLKVDIKLLDFK